MNKLIKSLTAVSLIAFAVTIFSVIFAGLIIYNRDLQAKKTSQTISESSSSAVNPVSQIDLNVFQVALHNTPSNCWVIISNNVYNLTTFLSNHPGGSLVITPYCGKDGTAAYNTKDKKPASKHSKTADNLLTNYFIGQLGQKIPQSESSKNNASNQTGISLTPTLKTNNALTQNNNTNTNNTLTNSSVSIHNTASNCWIIISGNVYNVTSYLAQHPGGVGVITPFCGGDATNAFATKGKNPGTSHSAYANNLLASYIIGKIGSAVQNNQTAANAGLANSTPSPTTSTNSTQSSGGSQSLTTSDVTSHNSSSNCWIIISGKVYNVTNYLTQHPGGVGVITPFCGGDATNAFATKGGRGSNHSSSAYNLLNNYLIGTLGSTTSNNSGSSSGSNTTPSPTSPQAGGSSGSGILPNSVAAKYPGATIISQNIEDNGSQELKINYNGNCRQIHVSSSGSISEDEKC